MRIGFLLILMLYLLIDFGFSMKSKELGSSSEKLLLIWVHFVIHISYGIGYLKGLVFSKKNVE